MSAWIDFVKRVQKRDTISYTEALRKASGEWKNTKSNSTKGAKSKPRPGKLDYTSKKGDIKVEKGHRMKGKRAY